MEWLLIVGNIVEVEKRKYYDVHPHRVLGKKHLPHISVLYNEILKSNPKTSFFKYNGVITAYFEGFISMN
jgi:hypothetical protein